MTQLQTIIDAARDHDDLVNRLVKLGVEKPAAFVRLLATQITATDLRRAINGSNSDPAPSVH